MKGAKRPEQAAPRAAQLPTEQTATAAVTRSALGLTLLAASEAYDQLRSLRGKVRFSRKLAELKADR